MKTRFFRVVLLLLILFFLFMNEKAAHAQTVVEEFEIQGLISPESPKTLILALETQLKVQVIELNLKDTPTGWPVIRVEYDQGEVPKGKIEAVIESTADPAGHTYKVRKGPLLTKPVYLKEEEWAISVLGPEKEDHPQEEEDRPQITNPIPSTKVSIAEGKKLYVRNCAKCHGLSGNGWGPSAQSLTIWPKKLLGLGKHSDENLFRNLTDGRTDMPPWGVILSEKERWDLINYIRTLEEPVKK
jgi:mono/diheme cytochrome c family protein